VKAKGEGSSTAKKVVGGAGVGALIGGIEPRLASPRAVHWNRSGCSIPQRNLARVSSKATGRPAGKPSKGTWRQSISSQLKNCPPPDAPVSKQVATLGEPSPNRLASLLDLSRRDNCSRKKGFTLVHRQIGCRLPLSLSPLTPEKTCHIFLPSPPSIACHTNK
jgi:hypothetical protein